MFKHKILKLITGFMLVLPLLAGISADAVVENEIEVVAKRPLEEKVVDVPETEILISNVDVQKTPDKSLEEIKELVSQQAEPKSKKVLFKFAIAILWVVISSLIIYFSLISYKKMSGKTDFGINVDENNLEAPKNFKEAVNLFLKKSKDE